MGYSERFQKRYGEGIQLKWFLRGFEWKELKGPTLTTGFSNKLQTKPLIKIIHHCLPDQDPYMYYDNYPDEEDSDSDDVDEDSFVEKASNSGGESDYVEEEHDMENETINLNDSIGEKETK
jgi:hypothetical protein